MLRVPAAILMLDGPPCSCAQCGQRSLVFVDRVVSIDWYALGRQQQANDPAIALRDAPSCQNPRRS
jgi:hypothetical protein